MPPPHHPETTIMNSQPEPPDSPESPLSALAQAAAELHELYTSLKQAGFTQTEALELIKTKMHPHT
jgi:hypothetical protein